MLFYFVLSELLIIFAASLTLNVFIMLTTSTGENKTLWQATVELYNKQPEFTTMAAVAAFIVLVFVAFLIYRLFNPPKWTR